MGIFNFLSAFGSAKVEKGAQDITKWLASIDPETATKAQLNILRDKRDEYAKRLVTARQALQKDQQETADVQAQIDKQKKALGILKSKKDAGDDSVLPMAQKIAEKIGQLNGELEREKAEDAQAQELVDALQKLYDQMSNMLQNAKGDLEAASRRMQQAQADKEHQDLMAELNGANESFSGLNVALDAMNEAADKAKRDAEVSRMNNKSSVDEVDDLVDNLLKEEGNKQRDTSDPFAVLN